MNDVPDLLPALEINDDLFCLIGKIAILASCLDEAMRMAELKIEYVSLGKADEKSNQFSGMSVLKKNICKKAKKHLPPEFATKFCRAAEQAHGVYDWRSTMFHNAPISGDGEYFFVPFIDKLSQKDASTDEPKLSMEFRRYSRDSLTKLLERLNECTWRIHLCMAALDASRGRRSTPKAGTELHDLYQLACKKNS